MADNNIGNGSGLQINAAMLESLSKISMFAELDFKQMDIVAGHTLLLTVDAGETVFCEGDKGDFVCFVAKGLLSVIKSTADGKVAELTTLPQGSSMGEMAVIDDFPRSATVIARKQSHLVTMTRGQFHKLVSEHPEIGIRILKGIARVLSLSLRKTSTNLVHYMLPVL